MLGFIDWTVSLLKLVCDFVYKHNFSQLVDCPTHVKGNILDLVLTTSESIRSSHCPLIFNMLHNRRRVTNACHDFCKADFEELCNHLLETDFSDCYNSVVVEDIWSTIKHAILYAMNLHIPMVKIKSHKHPKWYNSDIRHHLNCIRTLRKRCISCPTIKITTL